MPLAAPFTHRQEKRRRVTAGPVWWIGPSAIRRSWATQKIGGRWWWYDRAGWRGIARGNAAAQRV